MKRKLWVLNFVLIAAVAGGAWRLRKDRQEMRTRESLTLAHKPVAPPLSAAPPVAAPPSVTATSYLDIAQKMLWAKDRNSQVIVDPPKPPEPPKPLPPLPSVRGVMDLGDGPIVMMGETSSARHRGVHPGEMIGKFKLVSVDAKELVLAFEDRTVKKTLDELIDRGDDKGQVAGAPAVVGAGATSAAYSAATRGMEPAPPPPPPAGKSEPGVVLTEDTRSCQSGDSSPAGTIVNGMRKVVMQTPFGVACKWERVK